MFGGTGLCKCLRTATKRTGDRKSDQRLSLWRKYPGVAVVNGGTGARDIEQELLKI